VRRDTAPSRETRKGIATNVEAGFGSGERIGSFRMQAFGEYANDGTASAMKARDYKDATDLVAEPVAYNITFCDANGTRSDRPDGGLYVNKTDVTGSLTRAGIGTNVVQPVATPALYENHPNDSRVTSPHDVAPSCVSRYGTGGGNVPLVQEAIAMRESGQGYWMEDSKAGTLRAEGENRPSRPSNVIAEPVAVDTYNHALQEKAVPIRSTASDICHTGGVINPADRMAVRRLSPRECERLQGFNDDHTLIPWRNKPADQCPDSPRYKALGNSMAVPCMAWIGKRIDAVEKTK
jgi:DNA (cytosine-5)-methyltransferase 1